MALRAELPRLDVCGLRFFVFDEALPWGRLTVLGDFGARQGRGWTAGPFMRDVDPIVVDSSGLPFVLAEMRKSKIGRVLVL